MNHPSAHLTYRSQQAQGPARKRYSGTGTDGSSLNHSGNHRMSVRMTPRTLFRWSLPLLLSFSVLQACSAETDTPAQNWPTECVGRMQMRLPGPADTAAFSFIKMQDYIKRGGYPNGFTFANGVPAPFAQSIAISHPLTDTN